MFEMEGRPARELLPSMALPFTGLLDLDDALEREPLVCVDRDFCEGEGEGLETALTGSTAACAGLLSGTVKRLLRRLERLAFVLALSPAPPSSDVISMAEVAPVDGDGDVERGPE